MLKIKVNIGTRSGYIYQCFGKYGSADYKENLVVEFFICNSEKPCLNKIYDFIKSNVEKIATLTSTGKTYIALVKDNFFNELKVAIDDIQNEYHTIVAYY